MNFHLAEDIPAVRGDSSMLKQVVLNVILNAVQAADKSGGYIDISTLYKNNAAELIVTDRGKGIDEETLQRIFDPFFTTKAEGSGTGLTTSLRIIEQHGGELNIKSDPGISTMVQILLPVTEQEKFTQK